MLIARALYFLFFAAAASLAPFLSLYYQEVGLSGREIGFLTGIVPLITLVSASVWGAVADATRKHKLVLIIAIAGAWLGVFVMSRTSSFTGLIPAVAFYAFISAPIIPLVDNAVMTLLSDRKSEYGRERVWGSYGWGIAATWAGFVIQRTGLQWAFYSYLVLMALLFLAAMRMPVAQVPMATKFWRGLRELLANRYWLTFLATALVGGMSMGIFMNFLFLHLEAMGSDRTIMGLSLTMATVSEIPVFLYSRKFLQRLGSQAVMAIALLAFAARAFGYAVMTDPWQVLVVSLLHGPTFAAMWVAGVAYASELAPPGLGATAQGVFSSTVFGLGSALGAFIGGFLYDTSGPVGAFQWAGVASLLAFLLFTWTRRQTFARQWRRRTT